MTLYLRKTPRALVTLGALVLASPLFMGAGCEQTGQGQPTGSTLSPYEHNASPSANASADDEIAALSQGLTVCLDTTDCASDEACTQGGHCVNNTGERDASAIFQAEINALEPPRGIGVPYRLPPNGIYLLSDHDGDGVGLRLEDKAIFDGQGSRLLVEPDTIGIRVGQPSEWSMLRNFRIEGTSAEANESVGIDVRAHGVRLENILFKHVGTGARSHTNIGPDYANVNSQQWYRLSFDGIFTKAIDFRGGDANAGLILGAHVKDGAGIYERSFLGNTYIAPWIENTHTHSLDFASNAGRNVAIGAYIDAPSPTPLSASMHDVFVGGNYIDRVEGPGDRIGTRSARLHFGDPESGLLVRIPGSPNAALAFRHPNEDEWWFLRYYDHISQLRWGFAYRNSGTAPFFWTGADHPDGPGLIE